MVGWIGLLSWPTLLFAFHEGAKVIEGGLYHTSLFGQLAEGGALVDILKSNDEGVLLPVFEKGLGEDLLSKLSLVAEAQMAGPYRGEL